MPIITARILQSSGLNANKASIANLELGMASDTEQPVMGAPVAGPVYLGTEDFLQITTANPSAIPILRRSDVTIICDTATAGADIVLNIQNGATVLGFKATIVAIGTAGKTVKVTYGSGLVDYVPVGVAREYRWIGSYWQRIYFDNSRPVGEVFQMMYKKATSPTFPAIPLDTQADILASNYPQIVPELRAVKADVGGVTDHTVTVSGSSVTFPNTTEANALLKAMSEDAIVRKYLNTSEPANFTNGTDYTTAATQRTINVAGTDYVYTNIDLVTRIVTTTGTPTSGTQTASAYPHRIAGYSDRARVFKTSGFAPVNAGDAGLEIIGGYCKMDRGQGFALSLASVANTSSGGSVRLALQTSGSQQIFSTNAEFAKANLAFSADPFNGTPRTGKTTDPRTQSLHFYLWAAIYLP